LRRTDEFKFRDFISIGAIRYMLLFSDMLISPLLFISVLCTAESCRAFTGDECCSAMLTNLRYFNCTAHCYFRLFPFIFVNSVSWRVSVCHCVPYRPQPPLRLVKTWIHGTIAVQNLAKIDQNAQKSAKTANKKRP
jgi:hypothetical protein